MIHFKLEDQKYMIGVTELPTDLLLKYPHEIEGQGGFLDIPYTIGDEVWRYQSVAHRYTDDQGQRRKISEFLVFGGVLCCRFVGSQVPHAIDCVEPIQTSILC